MILDKQSNKARERGMAIIELMIALGVSSLIITGAILLVFGGQTAGLDVKLSGKGLSHTVSSLESSLGEVGKKWNLAATAGSFTIEGFYEATTTVEDISPCVKFVGSDLGWESEKSRSQSSGLGSLVGSIEEAKSLGSPCDPFPPNDWDTPEVFGSVSASEINGSAKDVVVSYISSERYAFLAVNHNSDSSKDDFYSVNVSDPTNPIVSPNSINTGFGLVNLAVNGDYIFSAHASSTEQFQVIKITDPENPYLVTSVSLPGVDPTGSYPEGRSIAYYDDKVYVGTAETSGPELHVFDVINPESPVHVDSENVGRNINDIIVRDGYIYIATGPGIEVSGQYNPLKILDLNLNEVGNYKTAGNQQGRSLYLLGSVLYLGRDQVADSENDFHVVDISDPANPVELGSVNLNLDNNSIVSSMVVQGSHAFMGTKDSASQDSLLIYDVSDLSSIIRINTCTAGSPLPQDLSGLVYSENLLYASFESNAGFRVIYDDPDEVCS